MKKLFAILLTLVIIFSFAACKDKKDTKDDNDNKDKSSSSSTVTSEKQNPENTGSDDIEGTELEDGSILYYEGVPSADVVIEFKDENDNVLLTTDNILKVSAKLVTDVTAYAIQLEFDADGTEIFKNATQENLGKIISLYIDGELVMSPMVNDVITDGKVVISGIDGKEELFDLYKKITDENLGSFTAEKTYSYDQKYYAIQNTKETDGISFVDVVIYNDKDEAVYTFTPARASDFWGICWEKDTYNIWIQSADIGVICYSYDNEIWTENNAATRPDYIISKYD